MTDMPESPENENTRDEDNYIPFNPRDPIPPERIDDFDFKQELLKFLSNA